ncbi:MAG: DUF4347 domain-containing protein, partial [Magnetococcales bacterium]|nr:DUF4347 domain-containing protein [Magnetococcales bacterium]
MVLEPRIMFDGAGAEVVVDAILDHLVTDHPAVDSHPAVADTPPPAVVREGHWERNNGRKEVAFVDTGVADYQTLVAGVCDGVEVVLLDGHRSGLAQMAKWAETHSGYDAIHVLSHGEVGMLRLGNDRLDTAKLSEPSIATELAKIGRSLTDSGDLLLYGCLVAQDGDSVELVKEVARLTRADVAASDDPTGSQTLGGDWDLETTIGFTDTDPLRITDFHGLLGTPSIAGLSGVTYIEQNSATALGGSVTVSGGTNYQGGYLDFSLDTITATETLSLTSDGSASTTNGQISIVGNSVYLGNGTTASVVGSIDSTLNGQNGNNLRINFVAGSSFDNGSFNTGSAGSTSFDGWTAVNQQVKFGTNTIAGLNTPTDTVWPTNKPGNVYTDQSTPTTLGTLTTTLSAVQDDGTGYSVILKSTGMTTQAGYDIVRGPYIYSNNSVALQANDTVSFQWQAQGGSDAYDVYCYIVDVNNSTIQTLLNQTGSSGGASTTWATVTTTVAQAGQYRFVFVSGTYDFSGGRAAGAQLYIDDVTVTQANPAGIVNDTSLSTIAQKVKYSNISDTPSASRTLTVTAKNNANTTGTATSTLTITPVNDTPIATAGSTLSYTEGGTATAIDATITVSDVDDTQLSGATVTISSGLTSGDVLAVTTQNGISGSYNSATGVLTLSGTASLANYQTALRSVTFASTSDDPTATAASRTVTWAVSDANVAGVGAQTSAGVTSTINLTATVDVPIATAGSTLSYTEGGAATAIDATV